MIKMEIEVKTLHNHQVRPNIVHVIIYFPQNTRLKTKMVVFKKMITITFFNL